MLLIQAHKGGFRERIYSKSFKILLHEKTGILLILEVATPTHNQYLFLFLKNGCICTTYLPWLGSRNHVSTAFNLFRVMTAPWPG